MTLLGFIQGLHWREPLWLLLTLQPFALLAVHALRQRRRIAAYAEPALRPWVLRRGVRDAARRSWMRDAAYILAWMLFAAAAAGPRLPIPVPGAPVSVDADVMVVVDMSRSMQATDITPSRLQRARIELLELLELLDGSSKQRLGIIVYAGHAHLYVPLTWDQAALNFYVKQLGELVLPTHGTNLAGALSLAQLHLEASRDRTRTIVLITDGDTGAMPAGAGVQIEAQLDALRADDIGVYVLGVGTVEGEAIPLANGGWLTDAGRAVVSRMDETALRGFADRTGGVYSPVRDDRSDWRHLYEDGIVQRVERAAPLDDQRVAWRELFPWALAPAVGLLFWALLPYRVAARHRPLPVALLGVLLIAQWLAPLSAHAGGTDPVVQRRAQAAFANADYRSAQGLYESLSGYTGVFGAGAAAYRRGAYARAAQLFAQAVLRAADDRQRGAAMYNLGNTYFQSGDYARAIKVYQDALIYQPAFEPARNNLAISEALQQTVLARLEIASGGPTSRMGAGPRQARAEPGTATNERGAIAIDESSSLPEAAAPLPTAPSTVDPVFEALVQRGLEHARVAHESEPGQPSATEPADLQGTAALSLRLSELEHQQALIWQRIFEDDAGFPAPLEQPRSLPGVAPW